MADFGRDDIRSRDDENFPQMRSSAFRPLVQSVTMSSENCVYNLFRNRQRPELVCAVPEDRPVPNFIVAEQWAVLRPLRSPNQPLPGFHHRAANAGVRFNGFHLFQVTADGSIDACEQP